MIFRSFSVGFKKFNHDSDRFVGIDDRLDNQLVSLSNTYGNNFSNVTAAKLLAKIVRF